MSVITFFENSSKKRSKQNSRIAIIVTLFFSALVLSGCSHTASQGNLFNNRRDMSKMETATEQKQSISVDISKARYEKATFAGGCFWCVESSFEKHEGIVNAVSGYSGGKEEKPTYETVSAGRTGHREAVQITYDPELISYEDLLEIFWKSIDPTDDMGQFADKGFQYTTAIFYHNYEQKKIAEESKRQLDKSGKFDKPIATQIIPYEKFYKAEEYHQDYYEKNPMEYSRYEKNSGRKDFIENTWNEKESIWDYSYCTRCQDANQSQEDKYQKIYDDDLKKKLTSQQYEVTQKGGTERAFDNAYWDNKEEGIYVDLVSGKPLFSSNDKYDSGTGWPSFTKPIDMKNIKTKEDKSFLMTRTEVKSSNSGSHLGHVFDDGPGPEGKRYCINSAALIFIPKDKLKEEGYEEYLKLFE
ncbi:MAG: peptide-methionine (S)-S-oxide reductase MsrA [Candidatus Woesearchaeota archaeon]